MKNRVRLIAVVSFLGFSLSSCVTSKPRKPVKRVVKESPPKAGSKVVDKSEAVREGSKAANFSTSELIAYVSLLSLPTASYGEKQRSVTDRLVGKEDRTQVEEAALTLGVLYEVNQGSEGFTEETLDEEGRPVASESSVPSLEAIANERGIDVIVNLSENPYLGSYQVHDLALKALSKGMNQPEYLEKVKEAIKLRADQWVGLHASLGSGDGEELEEESEEESGAALPFGLGDISSDDNVLESAAELADKGMHKEAVVRLQNLDEESLMYAAAQEKIVEYSNKAVQILRRKAAMAFQSSIPVSEVQAKVSYLQTSKGYLDEAINSFPHATQLVTVEQNLAVINRELEKYEAQVEKVDE